MRKLKFEDCKAYLLELARLIDSNKWLLIELDSKTGDGDLGLTMSLAFKKARELTLNYEDEQEDIGRFFSKIGFTISKAIPCTMSSLLGAGFLRVGSTLGGKTELTAEDFNLFTQSFSEGVMERGKVKPGDRTLLDTLYPVAEATKKAIATDANLSLLIKTAYDVALEGLESTKSMAPTRGKALHHKEQSVGLPDQGATVGMLIYKSWTKFI